MKKIVQEWINISEYDLKTAEAMLKMGRYLYVVFMCQQCIEKILKAIYSKKKNELPARTHNLLYLVDFLNLKMEAIDKEFLSELNQFYIGSRYPGEQRELAREVNKEEANNYLKKTKRIWKCLKQMLP